MNTGIPVLTYMYGILVLSSSCSAYNKFDFFRFKVLLLFLFLLYFFGMIQWAGLFIDRIVYANCFILWYIPSGRLTEILVKHKNHHQRLSHSYCTNAKQYCCHKTKVWKRNQNLSRPNDNCMIRALNISLNGNFLNIYNFQTINYYTIIY